MRTDRGHLASRRSDLQCAAIGLLIAALVAVAGSWIVERVQDEQAAELRKSTEQLGRSVARAVAETVQLALGYGIPFERLHGVPDYLEQVLDANPEVAGIELYDKWGVLAYGLTRPERKATYGAATGVVIEEWVKNDDQRVAEINLEVAGQFAAEVERQQFLLVLVCALAAGLGAAGLVRIQLAEQWDLPRAHLMASMGATARGVFADFSRIRRASPLARIGRLAVQARAPVRDKAKEVAALSEELTAIDIDGSLTAKVRALVGDLFERYRFERPARLAEDRGWGGWATLTWVLCTTMAVPLIGGFAADRVGFGTLSYAAAAMAFLAEALGGLLGLLTARYLRMGPARRLLLLLAVVAAGAATIAVAEQRDLIPFLGLRVATAFCLWFVVDQTLRVPGRSLRGPWSCTLLMLFGMLLGPLFGGLLADGFGRRTAFEVVGVLLLLTGPPVCFVRTLPERAARHKPIAWRHAAALASALAAAAAVICFYIASSLERHDYVLMSTLVALLGCGLGAGIILRKPMLAALGMAGAIAANWVSLEIPIESAGAMLLLGFSLGSILSRGWRRPARATGLAAALIGVGLGPALATGAIIIGMPPQYWMSLLLGLAFFCQLPLTTKRPSRTKVDRAV